MRVLNQINKSPNSPSKKESKQTTTDDDDKADVIIQDERQINIETQQDFNDSGVESAYRSLPQSTKVM